MKFKLSLLFVILILSNSKSEAHESVKILLPSKTVTDTLKDEFNAKKQSITALIKRKTPQDIVTFYQFYLQEKDQSRADSLVREILPKSQLF